MKPFLRITLISFLFILQICDSIILQAQCKVDSSDPVKGQFSINGTNVQVNGDGGGIATAINNVPIKICEGELITLKSTLPVNSFTGASYWILKLEQYLASSLPVQSSIGSIAGSYSTVNGSVDLKMIDKSSDPKGLTFYEGSGKYVIVQYDNSSSVTSGPGVHHACQVIEVIKPTAPVANVNVCSGSEFQITIPSNSNNIFDNYETIFAPVAGTIFIVSKTGKQKLPYTFKTSMIDNLDIIIVMRGLTETGGCNSPSTNFGLFSVNTKSISKPTVLSIEGTTQKTDFMIRISSQSDILHKIYSRESQNYDYTKVFKSYASISKNVADTIKLSVPNGDKQYCFRVEATDSQCSLTNILSNEEVCTTPASVTTQNNKNVISWTKANNFSPSGINPAPFIFYQMERLNPNGTVEKVFPIRTNIETLQEEDMSIVCGQIYTYRILTNYGIQSYSQLLKVTAKSDDIPLKIPNLIATIDSDNKSVFVQGAFNFGNVPNDVKPENYRFYRSNTVNGKFSLQKTGNSLLKDQDSDANKQSYCYYMTWTNLCDIESEPSEKVCTVFQKNNNGILEWTKESPHSVPTDDYIIQEVNSKGNNVKELGNVKSNVNLFDLSKVELGYGEEKFFQIETRPVGWNTTGINRLPSSLSNLIRIFKAPLAIEKEENLFINIYPNPSQDILTVDLKNDKPEIVNWTLSHSTGQLISQSFSVKPTIDYQSQINIKQLQKGIYLLKIDSGDKSIIRKIVKD